MIITGYKKFINIPIEIEVLTLGIVLCTVSFGIKAGLVVAILGGVLGFFVGLDISPHAFPMFMGYIMMVFISYALNGLGLGIAVVGLLTTIINNLLIFLTYHLIGYDFVKNLQFSISNILINTIIFVNLAPLILNIT